MDCSIFVKLDIPEPILQSQLNKRFNNSTVVTKKDIDTIDYGNYQDNEYVFTLTFEHEDILFKMYAETQHNPNTSEENPDFEVIALELYSQNETPVDYSKLMNKLKLFKNELFDQESTINLRISYAGITKL